MTNTARREGLVAEVREIFEASRQRYGAPRVHADLHARGRRISKRTVAKLMKENGIRPPRGKRRVPITTDSRHAHAVAPNLPDTIARSELRPLRDPRTAGIDDA